jgi:hypothetical protein
VSTTACCRPPNLTLNTTEADGCFNATIEAVPGQQGAALTSVSYSLTDGSAYTSIPLATLPFALPISGTGTIDLVAVAADASGQTDAQSTRLTLGAGCARKNLKVSGGSGQSAEAGKAFATPLSVLVTNLQGQPVAGAIVTFTAPISGAGATLSSKTAITNSSGIASVTATANSTAGSYQVTAAAANAAASVSFSLKNQ